MIGNAWFQCPIRKIVFCLYSLFVFLFFIFENKNDYFFLIFDYYFLRRLKEGGQLTMSNDLFSGTVDCPPSETVCCGSNDRCNGRGRCVRGACMCAQGFGGNACTTPRPGPSTAWRSRGSWSKTFPFPRRSSRRSTSARACPRSATSMTTFVFKWPTV